MKSQELAGARVARMAAAPIQTLVFDPRILAIISSEIMRHPAVEVAGLCYGDRAGHEAFARSIEISDEPRWHHSFRIRTRDDPERTLVCTFHSHPSGSLAPSIIDIRSMRTKRVPWVIAALMEGRPQLRAYIYEDHVIRRLALARLEAHETAGWTLSV